MTNRQDDSGALRARILALQIEVSTQANLMDHYQKWDATDRLFAEILAALPQGSEPAGVGDGFATLYTIDAKDGGPKIYARFYREESDALRIGEAIATPAPAQQAVTWRRQWFGSAPGRGFRIVRNDHLTHPTEVAFLGDQVSGEAVDAIIEAHNTTTQGASDA